jgi:hypothetical protein
MTQRVLGNGVENSSDDILRFRLAVIAATEKNHAGPGLT